MKYVLGLSGKDSLTSALLIKAHKPDLWEQIELFTTLTGCDYPETLSWLAQLPKLLGKDIAYIEGNLDSSIAQQSAKEGDKAFLPSQKQRYCTREAKIQPFEKWLGKDKAVLYTGIRADEARTGYKASNQVASEFPLVEFGFDLAKVWMLILSLPEEYRPPTFYWPEMHDLARQAWFEDQSSLLPLDEFLTYPQQVQLMAGRSRPNCFLCFNQRRYEVVWLCETHPDLFEKMRGYEKAEYSWIRDFPLSELSEDKRNKIKWNRARKIARAVAKESFGEVLGDGFETMASCGLFCGK